MKIDEDIVLIAGPTASGKTRLAIEIAQTSNGVIINTDSMQVYRDLRVVTARPSEDEETTAPHFLFGHRDGGAVFSVAQWLEDVEPVLVRFLNEDRKIIFVGGTGLYFNALEQGLSPMPEIKPDIRDKWRGMHEVTTQSLHNELSEMDPASASQLRITDRQRIIRALEVYESTGRSITKWQEEQGEPLLQASLKIRRLLLMPERKLLHERINQRFDRMVEERALEEVRLLAEKNLDPKLPVMKAIGVPQLSAHLRGEIDIAEAIEKAKAATRQYAKRQSTWFRNSLGEGWNIHSA